jgi:hypothetical protein
MGRVKACELEEKSIHANRKEAHRVGAPHANVAFWLAVFGQGCGVPADVRLTDENLSQSEVRHVWPHCLFGGDALPIVQVGFEEHSPGQRNLGVREDGPASSCALRYFALAVISQYPHSTDLHASE